MGSRRVSKLRVDHGRAVSSPVIPRGQRTGPGINDILFNIFLYYSGRKKVAINHQVFFGGFQILLKKFGNFHFPPSGRKTAESIPGKNSFYTFSSDNIRPGGKKICFFFFPPSRRNQLIKEI